MRMIAVAFKWLFLFIVAWFACTGLNLPWIAVLAACVPLHGWPVSAGAAISSLLLFRAFDIWKPWPVSALDRMHGGMGIMLDDVAAGLYALGITLALRALHLLR